MIQLIEKMVEGGDAKVRNSQPDNGAQTART